MKRILCGVLALMMLLSLCACGGAAPAPTAATEPAIAETAAPETTAEPAEDPMALYRTGSPWICSELEGVVTEETPADLKDDFALYINRDFYINAEILEGYSSTGTIDDLAIISSDELVEIFQDSGDSTDHDSQLAKAFYDLILDWDTRNALGVTPLKTETDVIEAMTELDDLIAYYRDYPVEKQLSAPFTAYMDPDLNDPDLYIATADSCGVFLKDSAEYSELTDLGALYLNGYRELAVGMLQKLDYTEARAREMWEEAYRLDELMAPYIYTSDENKDPDIFAKINNHMTRDEMIALQGRMPVVEMLELSCGFGRQDNWLVVSPGFFEAMQTIFTEENLPLLKSWIICHAAIDNSIWLDRDCLDLRWAFIQSVVGSAPQPDEILAAQLTQSALSWQTAHMYCDKFFTQQDKDAVGSVIEDVIATYKEMLLSEDFISEETKATALKKLDTLRIRNLFPDDWSAYTDPNLTFRSPAEGGSLTEALEALGRSGLSRMQDKIKKPVDHELWSDDMDPTTANCFYSWSDNSINILAAFCRGGVYADTMSREEIFGKIGIVIGHEITHAFDSTGAQFDETGAFRDWWTDADKAMFDEKNEKLAAYFSRITLWDGENVNGSIKTGETCADMGAMKCLLTMAAAEEDFDYDAFFRSYAELWRSKFGMYVVQLYQKDEHPMGYQRINTVLQQFDEFLDFYGITEGDGMYLPESERVRIW